MRLALSIEEVMKEIGIGRTKIYQLINSGELPAKKLHNRTIILRVDLDEYLRNLTPVQAKAI